jgi:hypothetical protein
VGGVSGVRRCEKRPTRLVILPSMFFPAISADVQGQCSTCMTCHDGCTRFEGWSSSPPVGDCNGTKDCGVAIARRSLSYLDSVRPGLFVCLDPYQARSPRA